MTTPKTKNHTQIPNSLFTSDLNSTEFFVYCYVIKQNSFKCVDQLVKKVTSEEINISPRVLSGTLKSLISKGLIEKQSHQTFILCNYTNPESNFTKIPNELFYLVGLDISSHVFKVASFILKFNNLPTQQLATSFISKGILSHPSQVSKSIKLLKSLELVYTQPNNPSYNFHKIQDCKLKSIYKEVLTKRKEPKIGKKKNKAVAPAIEEPKKSTPIGDKLNKYGYTDEEFFKLSYRQRISVLNKYKAAKTSKEETTALLRVKELQTSFSPPKSKSLFTIHKKKQTKKITKIPLSVFVNLDNIGNKYDPLTDNRR